MNIFSKLKIGQRLIISFGVLFALVIVGSSLFSIQQINLVRQKMNESSAEFKKTTMVNDVHWDGKRICRSG